MKRVCAHILVAASAVLCSFKGYASCDYPFTSIPKADDMGIVIDSQVICLSDATCPGNSSLVKLDDTSYLLAYRDSSRKTFSGLPVDYSSHVGLTVLDKKFCQKTSTLFLKSDIGNVQDPRLFWFDNKICLMNIHYVPQPGRPRIFYPACSYINSDGSGCNPVDFDRIINRDGYTACTSEKNWTPFVYEGIKGHQRLFFIQWFNPLIILEMLQDGSVKHLPCGASRERGILKSLWESRWGQIRGTSPAIRIGREYLTFIHSSFVHKGCRWYVFGALTFGAKPPFPIKRLSRFPIITRDMYSTPVSEHTWFYNFYTGAQLRVLWPSGFVLEGDTGSEKVHVCCGENESAIKILTMDLHKLLDSMHVLKLVKPQKATANPAEANSELVV